MPPSHDPLRADLFDRVLGRLPEAQVAAVVDDLLGLLLDGCGAHKALLVVLEGAAAPRVARGCSDRDLGAIPARVSSGVIGEALKEGRPLAIPSALEDVRVMNHTSVQEMRVESVLCVPLARSEGAPRAVLYVEGRRGGGRHRPEEVACAEAAGAVLYRLLPRLSASAQGPSGADPTAHLRARLRADRIVGRSAALAAALERASAAALNDFTVLLLGESGTGKTELARVIHDSSARASGPFVDVNCGSLPPDLVEAELFGVLPRVATGVGARPGRVELAHGGTLFLDEVTDLPPAVQARLLVFLQSREYWPVGASAPRASDVRVVAATNADVAACVRAGRFRDDLRFRLDVLPIRMPPLRERREDIPLLAEALLRRHRGDRASPSRFTGEAVAFLQELDLPGNVRELGTVVQRGIASAQLRGDDAVDVEHFLQWAPLAAATTGDDALAGVLDLPWFEATATFEQHLVRRALARNDQNVTRAARQLGIARSVLYEKLRRDPSLRHG